MSAVSVLVVRAGCVTARGRERRRWTTGGQVAERPVSVRLEYTWGHPTRTNTSLAIHLLSLFSCCLPTAASNAHIARNFAIPHRPPRQTSPGGCHPACLRCKERHAKHAKIQKTRYRETPDIVVRVHCKHRAELYFNISRKTKLSRLFNAWTQRMESGIVKGSKTVSGTQPQPPNGTTSSMSSMLA
ncbi:uncharacterized protein B0H18DRAFT_1120278 [Fomitopsis serialis]|uniref:uncharacterized protein n=1 Tax=Fomitopsis serialis TaxID=139415 RepID=UPI00200889A4|nr:uncharacterized protein B0H18DRAFT_1120278 [Neoantrodia serialis]KAH9923626.1 hypothetical protein B0H18DRAFT_1120278 [Neoantrodia serialis]